MRFNNTLSDVQPQARTLPRTGRLQAYIGTEKLAYLCRRNTGALVMNADMRSILIFPGPNRDVSTLIRVLNRVLQQIPQYLFQTPTIPLANNRLRGDI